MRWVILLLLSVVSIYATSEHEEQIELNHWTKILVGGALIDVCVHDGGIESFYAATLRGSFSKFTKADGQDKTKDNITPFYSWNGSVVYFVNTPRASGGYCILLIRDP